MNTQRVTHLDGIPKDEAALKLTRRLDQVVPIMGSKGADRVELFQAKAHRVHVYMT